VIAAGIVAGAGVAFGLMLIPYVVRAAPRTARAGTGRPARPASRHAVHVRGWGQGGLARSHHRPRRDVPRFGGHRPRQPHADLRVVGRGVEQHLIEKLTAAVAGLLLPPALALLASIGGESAPMSLVAVGALGLGAAGFVLPDALLRAQAAERRRDFRYTLSSYLDLAHIVLAAGAGVETALAYAAEAGDGWAFAELRAALHRSRLAGDSLWAAFQRLGKELDVSELRVRSRRSSPVEVLARDDLVHPVHPGDNAPVSALPASAPALALCTMVYLESGSESSTRRSRERRCAVS
jgi:tight adherence protein C